MSDAFLLAGKRGSGKTLGAIDWASMYLKEGRTVATNLDLFVEYLVPAYNTTRFFRLPDWPSAEDLANLPLGNPGIRMVNGQPEIIPGEFNEENNGLLLLDEVGNFLNSREWKGNGRQELINWLSQSRKFGWDLGVMAQHARMIDAQVREAFIEIQGTVRRLDKMSVPLVSPVWKYFTGKRLKMPKVHFVALKYGFAADAPVAERRYWMVGDRYKAYNTLQKIHPDVGQSGTSCMLSAYDFKGSKMKKWDLRRQMAAGGLVIGFLIGFGGGYLAHLAKPQSVETVAEVPQDPAIKVKAVVSDGVRYLVTLTDGRTRTASEVLADSRGTRYRIDKHWYGVQQ